MANRRSIAYDTAVRLLEDGEWHDYATIRRKVAAAIPPGPAMRAAQRRRKTQLDLNDPISQAAFIRSGQKILSLQVLATPGRFERDGKRIRMIPLRELTSEWYSEIMRRRYAMQTPEQRRAAVRHLHASVTPEQRSERVRRAWAKRTPEQRSEQASRANAKVGREQRSRQMREFLAEQSQEYRSARTRKSWETRRRKAAEESSSS